LENKENFIYFLVLGFLLYKFFQENETAKKELEIATSQYSSIIDSLRNQIKAYQNQIQNLIEKEEKYKNIESEVKKLRELINEYENKINELLEKERDITQLSTITPVPPSPPEKPKTPTNIPKIIPGSKFNITGRQSRLTLFCDYHTWYAIREKDGFDSHRVAFCHIPTLFAKKFYSSVYDVDVLIQDIKSSNIDGIFLQWWPAKQERQSGGPGAIAAAKKIYFIPYLDGDDTTFNSPDEIIEEIKKIYNSLIPHGNYWVAYNGKRMFAVWRCVSSCFTSSDWKYIIDEVNKYVISQEGKPLFFLSEGDFPDIFDGFWAYTTYEIGASLDHIISKIRNLYNLAVRKGTIFIPAVYYMFDNTCGNAPNRIKNLGRHGKDSHELWKACKKYNTHNIINICSYNEHHECTCIMPGKHWANEIILDTKLKWWCKAEKQDTKECMYGDIIWGLYKGILQREPDPAGFYFYVRHLRNDFSDKVVGLQQIAKELVYSPEFKNKVCSQYSIEEILEGFYKGLWDKPADRGFINSLTSEVRRYMSGGKSKAEALIKIFENTFITSSNFINRI